VSDNQFEINDSLFLIFLNCLLFFIFSEQELVKKFGYESGFRFNDVETEHRSKK